MLFLERITFAFAVGVLMMSVPNSGAAAPLRFAAAEMPKPDPCLPFITQTYEWLNENLPEGATFRYYSVQALEEAVLKREVDVVLSEAGVVGRLRLDGARPLFSAVSARHPEPKRSQGSVFFVRTESDIKRIADLKEKSLVATAPNDFTGFQAALGEIVRRGYDPEHFFSRVIFIGTFSKKSQQEVVQDVLHGRADAGVVRTCFIEDLEKSLGQKLDLRVVEPRSRDDGFACSRSTDLYPNWTISSVPSLPAEKLRLVMTTLLAMPKTEDGMFWSVASDFSAVDRLMHDLKIGPYENLRRWSWARVWEAYAPLICCAILAVVFLLFHAWRTSRLLAQRTDQLEAAFAERERLKSNARALENKFEKMQRSTTVGQLSNIFVHELKQPLQSIGCFSHGLLRLLDTKADKPELLRQGLERIEAEVQQAGGIIERVRRYAKGRATDLKPCDLRVLALESLALARHSFGSVRFDVHDQIKDGRSCMRSGDALEFQFIFHNVIKNAAEAAMKTDMPEVSLQLLLAEDGQNFVAIVEDNGPALSDGDFERLNLPLQSSKPDGLGLGLVVVRSLLEKYRGRISFQKRRDGKSGIRAVVALSLDDRAAAVNTMENLEGEDLDAQH